MVCHKKERYTECQVISQFFCFDSCLHFDMLPTTLMRHVSLSIKEPFHPIYKIHFLLTSAESLLCCSKKCLTTLKGSACKILMQDVFCSLDSRELFAVTEKWCRALCPSTSPFLSSVHFRWEAKVLLSFYLTAFWFHLSFIAPWEEMEGKNYEPFLSLSLFSQRQAFYVFIFTGSFPPSHFQQLHPSTSVFSVYPHRLGWTK